MNVGVHDSIQDIPRSDWDACFPADPEGWSYYRALEQSGLAAFSWAYFAAREGRQVLSVVPAFTTRYRLDTTIQGGWRTALEPVLCRLRDPLTVRLLCLGSPFADKCHLGFAPHLPAERRGEVAARLLAAVDAYAASHAIGLLAAKDIAQVDLDCGTSAAFTAAGFARQPSLPNALLALPHASEDEYLKSLPHAARRDVRRKLRSERLVRVEPCRGREALQRVPDIARLYEEQRGRSGVDFGPFETLTPAYFRHVLIELADAAIVFLYWHEDELAAFNFCYHSERLFIDKWIGFSQPLARTLNLYVVSWMTNVRYCLAHRIPFLQSGQTVYQMKTHLGSELHPNWILFRHRNPVLNLALRLAGPMLAPVE
jgi:predicted N-acyltransferase